MLVSVETTSSNCRNLEWAFVGSVLSKTSAKCWMFGCHCQKKLAVMAQLCDVFIFGGNYYNWRLLALDRVSKFFMRWHINEQLHNLCSRVELKIHVLSNRATIDLQPKPLELPVDIDVARKTSFLKCNLPRVIARNTARFW